MERVPDMAKSGVGPNLFIVGAPKCGTTSMYEYLRRHPQIFFPASEEDYWRAKEPNHLCPDLQVEDRYAIRVRQDYLKLYEGCEEKTWRGDASPYNLCSEIAPMFIRKLCNDPRILVMLRPPLDMLRSYHRDLLRIHLENITDFHQALQVTHTSTVKGYRNYLLLAQFAPQVERYLVEFGRHAVKIVLLEDLARAPERTIRTVFDFLGVDDTFRPDFRVYNETPRNGSLEHFFKAMYNQQGIGYMAQKAFPYAARRKFLNFIRRHEPIHERPDPRDDDLRREFVPQVNHLAELIDRDLSHWNIAPNRISAAGNRAGDARRSPNFAKTPNIDPHGESQPD